MLLFTLWLQIVLFSAGLKSVMRHTKKTQINSFFILISLVNVYTEMNEIDGLH